MPRRLRGATGGYVYHALNRAVGRGTLFDKAGDYEAFEKVLREAVEFVPMRLLAYCLMPNHWHLVLWPRRDEDLSEYMRWLTVTHTQRWHAHSHTAGTGPIYQGRFKSFPVQQDEHFLSVCRYVERNALRARLVRKAENWRWSSLWRREQGGVPWLHAWPLEAPADWLAYVNRAETAAELEALRRSVVRGAPYGSTAWQARTAKRLRLESSLRPRGRPHKKKSWEVVK
jgi:putative transposase